MPARVALVTGGASGIGRAVAERLAVAGASVAVADLSDAGQAVADQLGGLFIQADLSQRDDCERIVDQTVAAFGSLDILVNNAGLQHGAPVEEFPLAAWDQLLVVMLTAPFLLARRAWPLMKARGWGRIVNISSLNALRAEPHKIAYNAAKAGLLGLTRTLAVEGGPVGITAHAICPGLVRTPLVESQIPAVAATHAIPHSQVVSDIFLRSAPVKRFIEPSEIAALVAFLCSEEAGGMTGSPILFDQGIHASV